MDTRMGWIDSEAELSLAKQCELAGVSRATWYNRHTAKPASDDDLQVCRLIDEEYTRRPFYGSRRVVLFLKGCGLTVNRKRVQRLMATMGLAGMAPGPNTSKKHPQHKVYPYLLRWWPVTVLLISQNLLNLRALLRTERPGLARGMTPAPQGTGRSAKSNAGSSCTQAVTTDIEYITGLTLGNPLRQSSFKQQAHDPFLSMVSSRAKAFFGASGSRL